MKNRLINLLKFASLIGLAGLTGCATAGKVARGTFAGVGYVTAFVGLGDALSVADVLSHPKKSFTRKHSDNVEYQDKCIDKQSEPKEILYIIEIPSGEPLNEHNNSVEYQE